MSKLLDEKTVIENITDKCKKSYFTFIGFVGSRYNGIRTKLELKCNKCGNIFERTYSNLVTKEYKCPYCTSKKLHDEHIKPLNEVYSIIEEICRNRNYVFNGFCDKNGNDSEYIGVDNTFLKLHCNICGNDWKSTVYRNFVNGKGCPKCANNAKLSENEASETIREIAVSKNVIFHNFCDRDGNEINYNGTNNTYLNLECKICGNIWTTTTYASFKRDKYGCPRCHTSYLEEDIFKLLDANLEVEFQYNRYYDWLDNLQLDFYIPKYNVAIECQGKQHFIKESGWRKDNKEEEFNKLVERDNKKRKLCEEHGIKLLYYSNLRIEYPYKVYEDKNELLNEILKK